MAPKLPETTLCSRLNGNGKKDPDDDDDNDENIKPSGAITIKRRLPFSFPCIEQPSFISSAAYLSVLPDIAKVCLRSLAIATVALYVLNQKHLLPKPIGRVVSKVLFWPTIPITVSKRIGKWTTEVDDSVVIGGAPFGFMNYPEKLYKQFNVRGVVNMCDEYRGPVSSYKRLGIEQLWLPTIDHFEPSVEDLKKAVDFIQKYEAEGSRVYLHCRAGHGRSAAAVYAWLLYKEPLADAVDLNEKLCAMRDVRKGLWKQPNIVTFRTWLQSGGMSSDNDDLKSGSKARARKSNQRSRNADNNNIQTLGRISRQSDLEDVENLGQVFSDEDSTTDEDDESEIYDHDSYNDDSSEDELDYEMWRKYNRR
ncbi:hypothetical protein ACHAWO_004656 [Cyclotella atomus]|uniref:Tyrosine specific protein phosphatases domain-containing protein n=1 Tax=Cyclotella atomus TaxID=382360 RepID=A0ABD3MUF3_9STRA